MTKQTDAAAVATDVLLEAGFPGFVASRLDMALMLADDTNEDPVLVAHALARYQAEFGLTIHMDCQETTWHIVVNGDLENAWYGAYPLGTLRSAVKQHVLKRMKTSSA